MNLKKIWKRPIEFLYIDANYHDYELSKKDFLEWTAKLIDGGVVAVHNTFPALGAIIFEHQPLYGWPGPKRMLHELVFGSKNYKNVGIVDNITYAEKCAENSLADRIMSRLVETKGWFSLLALEIYRLLSRAPKPIKKFVKRTLTSRAEN